jgi:hypothetical protein
LTDAARVAGAHEPSGYLKRREQWYVAQTLHHREKIAELHLRAQVSILSSHSSVERFVTRGSYARSWLPCFRVTSSSSSTLNGIAGILSTARLGLLGCSPP